MNKNSVLITRLQDRLPEIYLHAQNKVLRAQPHLYPVGLFQTRAKNLEPYVAEIEHELKRMANFPLTDLATAHLAEKISQQVDVLTQSVRRQLKSKKIPKKAVREFPLSMPKPRKTMIEELKKQCENLQTVITSLERTAVQKRQSGDVTIIDAINKKIQTTQDKLTGKTQQLERLLRMPSWL